MVLIVLHLIIVQYVLVNLVEQAIQISAVHQYNIVRQIHNVQQVPLVMVVYVQVREVLIKFLFIYKMEMNIMRFL